MPQTSELGLKAGQEISNDLCYQRNNHLQESRSRRALSLGYCSHPTAAPTPHCLLRPSARIQRYSKPSAFEYPFRSFCSKGTLFWGQDCNFYFLLLLQGLAPDSKSWLCHMIACAPGHSTYSCWCPQHLLRVTNYPLPHQIPKLVRILNVRRQRRKSCA